MKVKIGSVEIVDLTMDELDEVIRRHGGGDAPAVGEQSLETKGNAGAPGRHATADTVILKRFAESGTTGLPIKDLGHMLGRRGKATRKAARLWAIRIKLCQDDNMDPFEDCRVGTQRGLRIKPSLLDIAKALAAGK